MYELALCLTLITLAAVWRTTAGGRGPDGARTRGHDDAAACWRAPGDGTTIYGHRLRGGMLFVGRGLAGVSPDVGIEPALVDPSLPIANGDLDWRGAELADTPSYTAMPASNRATYLAWLAEGRRTPGVGLAYPRLFLYGLERRLLHDNGTLGASRREAQAIETELVGLAEAYAAEPSFRAQLAALLRFLQAALDAPDPTGPPPRVDGNLGLDLAWRRGVCQLGTDGTPLPADWALAWLRSRPILQRAAQECACPEAFTALFRRRYLHRYGSGLALFGERRLEVISYQPASPSFDGAVFEVTCAVPEADSVARILPDLRALARDCRQELADYGRWLERHPGMQASVAALAWLPTELQEPLGARSLGQLRQRLLDGLAGATHQLIDTSYLLGRDSLPGPSGMDPSAWERVADLLSRHGWGLVPDPRRETWLAERPLSVAVYRLPAAPAPGPGADDAPLALALQLGVELAAADGRLDPEELEVLAEHSTSPRSQALLDWLWSHQPATPPDALTPLSAAERRDAGDLAVRVAWADGRVVPAEVACLTAIYQRLGLDLPEVLVDLHARTTASARPAVGVSATLALMGDEHTLRTDPEGDQRATRQPSHTAHDLEGNEITFLRTPLPFLALAQGRAPERVEHRSPVHVD